MKNKNLIVFEPDENDPEELINIANNNKILYSPDIDRQNILLEAITNLDHKNKIFTPDSNNPDELFHLLFPLFRRKKIFDKQFITWMEYAQTETESHIKAIYSIFNKDKTLTEWAEKVLRPALTDLLIHKKSGDERRFSDNEIQQIIENFFTELAKEKDPEQIGYVFEHLSKLDTFFDPLTTDVLYIDINSVDLKKILKPTIIISKSKNNDFFNAYFVKNQSFVKRDSKPLKEKIPITEFKLNSKNEWELINFLSLKKVKFDKHTIELYEAGHIMLEQNNNKKDITHYIALSHSALEILKKIMYKDGFHSQPFYIGDHSKKQIEEGERREVPVRKGTLYYPKVKYSEKVHNLISSKLVYKKHDEFHAELLMALMKVAPKLLKIIFDIVDDLRKISGEEDSEEIWNLIDVVFFVATVEKGIKEGKSIEDILILLLKAQSEMHIVYFCFLLDQFKDKEKWKNAGINISNKTLEENGLEENFYNQIKNDPFPIQYLKYVLKNSGNCGSYLSSMFQYIDIHKENISFEKNLEEEFTIYFDDNLVSSENASNLSSTILRICKLASFIDTDLLLILKEAIQTKFGETFFNQLNNLVTHQAEIKQFTEEEQSINNIFKNIYDETKNSNSPQMKTYILNRIITLFFDSKDNADFIKTHKEKKIFEKIKQALFCEAIIHKCNFIFTDDEVLKMLNKLILLCNNVASNTVSNFEDYQKEISEKIINIKENKNGLFYQKTENNNSIHLLKNSCTIL